MTLPTCQIYRKRSLPLGNYELERRGSVGWSTNEDKHLDDMDPDVY